MLRWFARSTAPDVDRAAWIDDAAWLASVRRHPFLDRLNTSRRERLRDLCGRFLAAKAISGAAGFQLDEAVTAGIAIQACLPVLELGLEAYPRFEEIIVYPGDFVVDRSIVDEDGVVHQWTEAIAGESWDGGPIVLAWDAASGARSGKSGRPSPFAFNVVIHEFVHKLDMANGAVDGMPAFTSASHPRLSKARWREVLEACLDDFAARVDAVEDSIPRHVDPESARADKYYAALPLDAYAATDEGEFFSVSSEAFFVTPRALSGAYPEWFGLLAAFYRQDPFG